MSKAIGIDFGLKRVGLALSDKMSMIASPYKTLTFKDNEGKKDFVRLLFGSISLLFCLKVFFFDVLG